MPSFTAKCGCKFSCWVTDDAWGGCCCGDCYNSWGTTYTIEDAEVEQACPAHGG